MDELSEQVAVMISPSQERDLHSVDKDGHVYLLVSSDLYGFHPDPSEPRAKWIKGCKGIIVKKPRATFKKRYSVRARKRMREIIKESGPTKFIRPTTWVYFLKTEHSNINSLVAFLEKAKKHAPTYTYYSKNQDNRNCVTLSMDALSKSNVLNEPSFQGKMPDDLQDFLELMIKQGSEKIIDIQPWGLKFLAEDAHHRKN